MDNTTPGKRLAPKHGPSPGGKVAVIVIAVLLALLVGGYAVLCALASDRGRLYPNTTVMGVQVGRMTAEEARAALDAALDRALNGSTVTIALSDGSAQAELPAALVELDGVEELMPSLSPTTDGTPVPLRGFRYVQSLFTTRSYSLPVVLSDAGKARIDQAAAELTRQSSRPMVSTTWIKEEDAVTFRKGSSGQSVDTAPVQDNIMSLLSAGLPDLTAPLPSFTVTARLVETPLPPMDLEDIARQVLVEPQDAHLDPETKEILPASPGVCLDVEAARALLDSTREGADCTIALTHLEPEIHADDLDKIYYQDLLASAESRVTGTSARISNVNVGQKYIDGTVLLPGEVFSYMALVAPYSAERGFKPASVYAGGGSRDELGGGLCQVSSTLYLACLRADLEIVERHQHAYIVSYLPSGMDATIYSRSLDYKFRNSTEFPMRIDFTMERRSDGYYWLKADLYGTKVGGGYVEITNKILSTNPAKTLYKIDNTIPAGTRKLKESSHDGQKVEVYRNYYDKDGNLLESKLESTNNFRRLDLTYLINSADAAKYGVDPVKGGYPGTYVAPSPTPTVEPTPTPTIEPTPAVEPTPVPTVEPTPVPTVEPTAEPTPVPTVEPTPVPTVEPTPVPTVEPTPVPTVEPTPVPTVEPTPVPTVEPTPVPTVEPTPVPTAEPAPVPTEPVPLD